MLLALGVLVVLVSGGIDVSFTAVALVSAYASVLTMLKLEVDSIFLGVLTSSLVGTVLGAWAAVIIQILRLPMLVVTLGTMSVYHGLMALILGTKSYPLRQMPQSMVKFGSADMITNNVGDAR